MQLGFVSAILPEVSLEEVLRFAQQVGYQCVEMMCWPPGKADRRYAGVTHINVEGDPAPLRRLLEQSPVQVSGLGYYPNPLSPDADESQQASEHLAQVIRFAAQIGIPQVNSFIGRDWTKSIDDNWPQMLATWKPLVALAEREGVRLGIENCPMSFTQDEWPGARTWQFPLRFGGECSMTWTAVPSG